MPSQNKKICFVVAADITLKFLLISELRFFRQKGYEVFAVCPPGKWLGEMQNEGVTIRQITIARSPFTPFSDAVALVRLFLYFKKETFDVVLTFTPKPGLLGQLAACLAGVPVVVNTIFGFYFHESTPPFKRAIFIFIEKIAAACSSIIFFRNREDFETAEKEHIGRPKNREYIGDGIDIAKYNSARFSEEFILQKKKSLQIAAGVPVIGIVARLVKEKGYVELFEAFTKVLETFPQAILLAVGPADLQKKDSINPDHFKQKNVIFLGERTDVDELYAVMDVFVLPSYREGFPHSVMEASAMARPVVTTNVRGCRNAIEPGQTGILVPPKNAAELAKAITSLLSDPKTAKQMGEAGRRKAEKDFDKNVLLQKMFSRINALL